MLSERCLFKLALSEKAPIKGGYMKNIYVLNLSMTIYISHLTKEVIWNNVLCDGTLICMEHKPMIHVHHAPERNINVIDEYI